MASHYNEMMELKSKLVPIKLNYECSLVNIFSTDNYGTYRSLNRISSNNSDIGDEWEIKYAVMSEDSLKVTVQLVKCLKIIEADSHFNFISGLSPPKKRTPLTSAASKKKVVKQGDFLVDDWNPSVRRMNLSMFESWFYGPNETFEFDCRIGILEVLEAENTSFNDIRSLFNYKKFGNLTLKFNDKKLRVMKEILSARSPVFATIFNENQSDCIEILDIEFDVFREMLYYIYTDKLPKVREILEKLLIASDRYQLNHLKEICEDTLHGEITIETVLDTLNFSEQSQNKRLRNRALRFMVKNKNEVLESAGFQALLSSNSAKATAIMLELLNLDESQGNSKT